MKRDEAIRRMRASGATLRAVAEVAGLSHTQIKNICRAQDGFGGKLQEEQFPCLAACADFGCQQPASECSFGYEEPNS